MKGRTLLVPDSNGSVEHFYHFLLAYLFPVTAWISARQHPHVAVRSCGPMTPWFDLLQDQATIDVVHPGVMLSAVIGRREPHVVLPQLDNPVLFERRTFADVARTIRGGDHPARVGGPLRIVLTDRGPSDPYYVSEGSERRTSAAERRSLANPDEIERVLQSAGSVTVVDAASMPPGRPGGALHGDGRPRRPAWSRAREHAVDAAGIDGDRDPPAHGTPGAHPVPRSRCLPGTPLRGRSSGGTAWPRRSGIGWGCAVDGACS